MSTPSDPLALELLDWYRPHARMLPWRSDPRPYYVLLSELMCQQTRVETALPYFERFIARWPTLEDFARAEEDQVVLEWAGLGYYSRARNLLKAARAAVERGGIPHDPEQLRALPGIGPYTAGAIASIAFGIAEPAVDGNVERVLSRVDGRQEDPKSPAGAAALYERAKGLLEGVPAGDLNQALMELGARVCTPRNPNCAACPWAGSCVAEASGSPQDLPNKKKKAPPTVIRAVAGIWSQQGAVLCGQRPPGLLGGMWEPISAACEGDPATTLSAAFLEKTGLKVKVGQRLGEVLHIFSHRRLTLEVYEIRGASGVPSALSDYEAVDWVDAAQPHVALSTLARKTLALAQPQQPELQWLAAEVDDDAC